MPSHQSKSYSPDSQSAVTDYLTHLTAGGRSPATIESYARSLGLLGKLLGPNIPLEELSADRTLGLRLRTENLAVQCGK
ncbi:MAG: hypothetical protein ABSE56_11570 [Bryobacteraceae bacterium]|jgi:hypothetical protein